jgi:hypothetical protein
VCSSHSNEPIFFSAIKDSAEHLHFEERHPKQDGSFRNRTFLLFGE